MFGFNVLFQFYWSDELDFCVQDEFALDHKGLKTAAALLSGAPNFEVVLYFQLVMLQQSFYMNDFYSFGFISS